MSYSSSQQEEAQPASLSHAGRVVLSLFNDIDAAKDRIVPESAGAISQAQELVNQLGLVYQQVSSCPGAEGDTLLARALLREALIRMEILSTQPGNAGRNELQKAVNLAQKAVSIDPQPNAKMVLASAYAELGDKKQAVPLLEEVAALTQGEVSVEAQKMLLRLKRDQQADSDIVGQLISFVTDHAKPLAYFLISFVFYLASNRFGDILALHLLLRVGWFLNLCIGIILFLKELITKKPS